MKKKKIRTITSIALGLVVIFSLAQTSCKRKDEKQFIMVTKFVLGDVKVKSQSGTRALQPGDGIAVGSTVITGKGSLIDMQYGNKGVFRLSENTELRVDRLISTTEKDDSSMTMEKGKVFVVMSKFKKGSSLKIKTPTAVASVRGTTFKVSAGKKTSRIDVLSGKIRVNPVQEGKIIEEVEKEVEKNKTVELNEKDVEEIITKEKKEITVAALKTEEIDEIREEAKNINADKNLNTSLQKEAENLGIKIEIAKEVKKKDDEKELEEKKKKEEAERKKQAEELKKKEEKNRAMEKLKRERLNKERLKKKRLEEERIAREKLERKKKKEQEKKEGSIKNIPTL
jgi:type I site-specific restriction-modification system R (restriction) subunit